MRCYRKALAFRHVDTDRNTPHRGAFCPHPGTGIPHSAVFRQVRLMIGSEQPRVPPAAPVSRDERFNMTPNMLEHHPPEQCWSVCAPDGQPSPPMLATSGPVLTNLGSFRPVGHLCSRLGQYWPPFGVGKHRPDLVPTSPTSLGRYWRAKAICGQHRPVFARPRQLRSNAAGSCNLLQHCSGVNFPASLDQFRRLGLATGAIRGTCSSEQLSSVFSPAPPPSQE